MFWLAGYRFIRDGRSHAGTQLHALSARLSFVAFGFWIGSRKRLAIVQLASDGTQNVRVQTTQSEEFCRSACAKRSGICERIAESMRQN
jgi:hypothetical protein